MLGREENYDPAIENLVELSLYSYVIIPEELDTLHIWGSYYLLVWIALDPISLKWYLNFLNYMDNWGSKEFQQTYITEEAYCLDMEEDKAASHYP